jgi:hypothetical protein
VLAVRGRATGDVNVLAIYETNGEPNDTFDVFYYIALCKEHCE